MTDKFPPKMKITNTQIQEGQCIPNGINKKETHIQSHNSESGKHKEKEKILKQLNRKHRMFSLQDK